MALIRGMLATILAFVVVGGVSSTLLRAGMPADFDGQGHLAGRDALLLAVLAQALSVFVAGAVAGHLARGRRAATTAMGAALFGLLALATWFAWPQAPAWFNLLSLAMTPPFVALGAAWNGRRLREPPG